MKHHDRFTRSFSLLVAVMLVAVICSPSAAVLSEPAAESFKVYFPVASEPSEYGYITPRWQDENGVELELGALSAPTQRKSFFAADVLPSAYDSRDAGYITSVKYQSDANICWAFTAMGVLEVYDISHGVSTVSNTDYSETHLAWFTQKSLTDNTSDGTYGDGLNRDTPYTWGGNWCYTTGTLARWSGITDETEFPFDTEDYATLCVYTEAERYADNGRLLRSMEQLSSAQQVKQAIYDNGAVEVAINYEDNIEATAANGDYVYYSPTTGGTNHSIMIVGWDDAYPVTNFPSALQPSSPGAWLIRNSWSEFWGDEGYMWVSYETGSLTDFVSYTSMSSDGYDNNYQYDGFGISNSSFYSAADVKTANVFTSGGNEMLKSVCFYTVTQNTACTVKIYKNISASYSSPVQGTLAYTSSLLYFGNTGYYTVDLEQEVELEADEIFSVVISYSGTAGFPVEPYVSSSNVPAYSANVGESYYAIGTSSWYDFVETGDGGNLHIKALTEDIVEIQQAVPNTSIDDFMVKFRTGLKDFFELLFTYIFARP